MVNQMFFCMILIISLFHLFLVPVGAAWWRKNQVQEFVSNSKFLAWTIYLFSAIKSKPNSTYEIFFLCQEFRNNIQLTVYHSKIELRYGQLAINLNYSIMYNSQLTIITGSYLDIHSTYGKVLLFLCIIEGPIVSWEQWADRTY